MSRIGKMPITIPSGVEVNVAGQSVSVKGPKGTLTHVLAGPIAAKQEGFISGFHIESNPTGFGKTLVLDLKFGSNRERSIAGLRRVSKPGLRVYAKSTSLPKVLGGLGVAIISTSSGLLTDKQANKQGVGGEVLAYVW